MTTTKNNEHKKLNFSSEREQSQACLNSAEHEKNQGRKVLNVPNLRFPEFQGEWEKCKLGNIANITGGYAFKSDTLNSIGGKYQVVKMGNLYQNQLDLHRSPSYTDTLTRKAENVILRKDDIAITLTGTNNKKDFGYTYIFNDEKNLLLNQRCGLIRAKGNPYFLSCLLKTHTFLNQFFESATGGTGNQANVSTKAMEMFSVNTPSLKEQEKIGQLMALLDERIATQNKIIEDLKKLKSAIIEKVFCSPNQEYPMCRIEGFEQALSTYKMCDFSSRIATKNKDSKCSLVLTIAAQYGLVNQESFFNKSVASENLTGYYLLHKGEFAYNRSYSAGYDWGAVKRLDNYDEGVLSTLYICFKINETIVDSDYLAYYFESTKWHRGLSDIAGEGARNHGLLNVSITDYFNTKHRFPVIEEQKAIAKMLNTITEKERKATLLGECYQKQKQYLLRQMFI